MAKIILKSPYLKPVSSNHIKTYVKYIATRDGVVPAEDTSKYLEATVKQKALIQSLVKDFPDIEDSYEYQDYVENPNRENASELITCGIENNVIDRGIYLKYISERPGVEKISSHGLFTDEGVPIVISKIQNELENINSNVWTHIISLRREDAERLGYNNVQAWQNLLRCHANEIARYMHIPPENFRWYAAFHNEGHHPHVHMIAYSTYPKQAYLSKEGIMKMKSSLAMDIFRDDSSHYLAEKDLHRDNIKSLSVEIVHALVSDINNGIFDNPEIENKLVELAKRLANTSGKKVYGGDNFDNNIPLAIEYLRIASEQGNQYAEQMLYSIQKHKNTMIASSSLRLLQSLARLMQNRIQDDNQKKQHGVDRKEQQKINEKKQAHGLRISM